MKMTADFLEDAATAWATTGTVATIIFILWKGPHPTTILIILATLWLWASLSLAAHLVRRAYKRNTFLWKRDIYGPSQYRSTDETPRE